MLQKWSRAVTHLSRLGLQNVESRKDLYVAYRNYSKVAAAATATVLDSTVNGVSSKPEVKLNKMFWSKPSSLALAPDSPLRIEEPKYEGLRRIILKLMLFYSKQSKSIRGANVVYRRIIMQVDKPSIYNVFNLEKTFKTTFSLLVLHMWLCLRRLKEEGKEGVEFGQYLYEIYNHDVELRVSKAGVNLLLTRWMKDLEKIFYGNIVAYDAALLPEAQQNEFPNVIWRNVFSDDGSPMPNDTASVAVQAMSRYARRESNCLSLTACPPKKKGGVRHGWSGRPLGQFTDSIPVHIWFRNVADLILGSRSLMDWSDWVGGGVGEMDQIDVSLLTI